MAPSKVSISACPTDLLHVVLNALWHIVVDDRLNVCFVNAHGECDGAAKHPHIVCTELLLDIRALLISLTCMVCLGRDPLTIEEAGDLLRRSALRGEQEDRGESLETRRAEESHECFVFSFVTRYRKLKVQARQVRLSDEVVWMFNVEYIANLFLCRPSCSGCQPKDHSSFAKLFPDHLMK